MSAAVSGSSGGPDISPWLSANTASCPAVSVNLAAAAAPSTSKLAEVDRNSRSAPPLAVIPPGTGVRIGWTSPYSGRGA